MIFRPIFAAASALVLSASLVAPAFAQASAVALNGDVKVVRQVEEGGKTVEKLEEPSQVVPGDRLLFTTRYNNTSSQKADDFVVTNPLPAAVKLTKADGFEVSVDGGKTFGAFNTLKVAAPGAAPRAAELGDVTHVRWRIASIAPGASGELRYFAEVR